MNLKISKPLINSRTKSCLPFVISLNVCAVVIYYLRVAAIVITSKKSEWIVS